MTVQTFGGLLMSVALLSGCGAVSEQANTEQEDTTVLSSYTEASEQQATLYSAFYGLDDAIPFIASYRICGEFGHKDGMPVIFSKEIDLKTLQAGDFLVHLSDGSQVRPGCVTPAPANDSGELRTILTIGEFGSVDNQPHTVEITGNLISLDGQTNYRRSLVGVTALEDGPTLVRAEIVPPAQWVLDQEPSALPFGGGSGCPLGTQQIVRAVWSGGVTKPGGDEIDDLERAAYRVRVVGEAGTQVEIEPFAIADLGDGDNNHKLCLDVTDQAIHVAFPEGLMTDPRDDPNPATGVMVSP